MLEALMSSWLGLQTYFDQVLMAERCPGNQPMPLCPVPYLARQLHIVVPCYDRYAFGLPGQPVSFDVGCGQVFNRGRAKRARWIRARHHKRAADLIRLRIGAW